MPTASPALFFIAPPALLSSPREGHRLGPGPLSRPNTTRRLASLSARGCEADRVAGERGCGVAPAPATTTGATTRTSSRKRASLATHSRTAAPRNPPRAGSGGRRRGSEDARSSEPTGRPATLAGAPRPLGFPLSEPSPMHAKLLLPLVAERCLSSMRPAPSFSPDYPQTLRPFLAPGDSPPRPAPHRCSRAPGSRLGTDSSGWCPCRLGSWTTAASSHDVAPTAHRPVTPGRPRGPSLPRILERTPTIRPGDPRSLPLPRPVQRIERARKRTRDEPPHKAAGATATTRRRIVDGLTDDRV
ncbi:hypothetical protein KM043_003312 [Ampulex compressa]|nr:hypothetical protein KM043_003312 [Ampulex compressa]